MRACLESSDRVELLSFDDLGVDAYDAVLIAQLVHHFSDEENRELAARVAPSASPGGAYAILDAFRYPSAKYAGRVYLLAAMSERIAYMTVPSRRG